MQRLCDKVSSQSPTRQKRLPSRPRRIADPHVRGRDLVEWIEHASEGSIPQIANPLSASGFADTHRRGAPSLGADNDAILADLSSSKEERARLCEFHVIGP